MQAIFAHRARSGAPRTARPRPTCPRRTPVARGSVLLSTLPLTRAGAPPAPVRDGPDRPRLQGGARDHLAGQGRGGVRGDRQGRDHRAPGEGAGWYPVVAHRVRCGARHQEPAPESQQHVNPPKQLSRGAIVQFEANGALQHGKVRTWGKQGARVVTHEGEFDVAWEELKGLGVHPDVAEEQPEVMAQAAAKQAGPATPQEDRPIQSTQFTLDDFEVGQHVTVESKQGKQGQIPAGGPYSGTVTDIGMKHDPNLIHIKLDTATQGGLSGLWIYPHEVTGIDEPVEEQDATESSTSAPISSEGKEKGEITGSAQTPTREADKVKMVGHHVKVRIGDHLYPDVKVLEAYPDGFKGDYRTPDGALHRGFFGWSEVTGPGSTSSARRPGTSTSTR